MGQAAGPGDRDRVGRIEEDRVAAIHAKIGFFNVGPDTARSSFTPSKPDQSGNAILAAVNGAWDVHRGLLQRDPEMRFKAVRDFGFKVDQVADFVRSPADPSRPTPTMDELSLRHSQRGSEELERASGEIEHAGQFARLEFQRMYWEQEAAFTNTLPVCRGLR